MVRQIESNVKNWNFCNIHETRGIELWFPHSTLKFSVRRRRRFQTSQTRKILPPGGCVCTLHDTLELATLFLTFKINFNIKKSDYAGNGASHETRS
jgi:hypothetical protein